MTTGEAALTIGELVQHPAAALAQPGLHSAGPRERRGNAMLFALLIAAVCGWVLSLPVFPSQDGPAHKFYAGVLALELSGDPYAHAYTIRKPVPPYASQDYLLAAASRVMDIDLAEKLFVCLVIVATAYGVRVCCLQMGPSGGWASLFVVPLLLHWPLMMGYMNYAFGLGLMLICFWLWMRAGTGGRSARDWTAFALTVALLTFSHPVPLMMLLLLCGYDLATRVGWARWKRQAQPPAVLAHLLALGYLGLALLYPLLSSDRSRSNQDLRHTMFKWHGYISDLLLHGLSPFYRHSTSVAVVLSKAGLYAILIGGAGFAAWGLRRRLRENRIGRPDFMLLAGVLLYAIIPIMPNSINGAIDFFNRMLVMVWIFVLFGASQFALEARGRRWASGASLVFALLLLVPAELYLRPTAMQLAALDHIHLPPNQHGLILSLKGDPRKMPGLAHQLEPSPYLWSSMVPMLHAHDVPINSPWMDVTYFALKLGSDPKMLYNIVATRKAQEDIDKHDGDLSHMSGEDQRRALAAADFIFAVRNSPSQVDLSSQLGAAAQGFQCSVDGWYLLCLHRAG